jgi:hypothetical protein
MLMKQAAETYISRGFCLLINEPLPPTRCLEVGGFSVNMLN